MMNEELSNGVCIECLKLDAFLKQNEERTKFLSYWNYGNKFDEQSIRIVFVGKTTWMDSDEFEEIIHIGKVWDIRPEIRNPEVAYKAEKGAATGAFWRYVKDISCEIHGLPSDSLEFLDCIYVTNLKVLASSWRN